MHRRYCSLADAKYLPKFVALHESLVRHSSEPFTLDFLTLDTETFWLLDELRLANVNLHQLGSFETQMQMKSVKASRSYVEYCWTLASCYLEFLMSRNRYEELAYLDSDLFFFGDPKVIFDEIGQRSIAIVPHRFSPENRHLLKNGKFNVGFISFKATQPGLKCLQQWSNNCRNWCFYRNEGSLFADQGYLNDFERDYGKEVAVLENIGVGVAPWNLQQYRVTEGPKVDGVSAVFFHAHEYVHGKRLTNYPTRPQDREFIYHPYSDAIESATSRIVKAEGRISSYRDSVAHQIDRA